MFIWQCCLMCAVVVTRHYHTFVYLMWHFAGRRVYSIFLILKTG